MVTKHFIKIFFATTGLYAQNMQKDTTRPKPCLLRKITLSWSLLLNISKTLLTTHALTLLFIPRTIQDFHAHLYAPCAIQDFHASIVLPKGCIDYIRPLGHIGFSCIYTSLGPYRIYMHLYVPRELQEANMAWYFLQISSSTRAV